MASNAGATSKGVCSEVRGEHRDALLRNVRKAILAGSLLLPLARSAYLVDSLSIHDDHGAVQLGFDAEVRNGRLSPTTRTGLYAIELAVSF